MTLAAEAPTPTPASLQSVPLALLSESKSNPRKTWGDITGLAESILQVGVLEPVIAIRDDGKESFTLVCGHRRFRAAKKAGLTTIPAIIRAPMTDKEVLEAQVVENSARADVHPLEEAEGYERLHVQHGLSVDDIAAKVNKSKAAVYARMKLCALCPEARKAFYDELLTPSTALFVARIPHHDLQRKALADLTRKSYGGELPSAREAFRIVTERFMLRLAEAPFPTADVTLVAAAGSCSTCPKRTGNQPELFSDVKSADVCTDPKCWEDKRKAALVGKTASLEAKGVKVLVGVADDRAFRNREILPPKGYAKASEYSYEHRGTYGEALKRAVKKGGKAPERVVMFDQKGKPVDLVRMADAPKPPSKAASSGASGASNGAAKVHSAKEKARKRIEETCMKFVRRGMKAEEAIRFFLLGWSNRTEASQKTVAKSKGPELVVSLVEAALDDDYISVDDPDSRLAALCGTYKVDWKGILDEELAKVAPKAKGEAKSAKPAKKSGGKK